MNTVDAAVDVKTVYIVLHFCFNLSYFSMLYIFLTAKFIYYYYSHHVAFLVIALSSGIR